MARLLALVALLLFALTSIADEREPLMPRAERSLGADRFVAGGSALVTQPVAGDLVAAGGQVDVFETVGGDAVLAGGRVRLDAAAGQDLYAAGGRVAVNAPVARNARIAGGNVLVGPRTRIGGSASIAGGTVDLLGAVDGYVQAAAGRLYIDAPVAGDVEAIAREIELGPKARIGGRLRYASEIDLVRHADAQVLGGVERFALDLRIEPHRREARALAGLWTAGLMLLGAVLVLAFPQTSRRVAASARERFGWCLVLGFVGLVTIPAAALLCAITGIGLPLALVAVLAYFGLLLVGYVAAGAALGSLALERWSAGRATRAGSRAAAAALGVLVLALLAWVPFVGAAIALVALLAGLGAILLQFRRLPAPA